MMKKRTMAALAAMTLLALATPANAAIPPDIAFVWVPGGTFEMGIEGDWHLRDAAPVRTVTISSGFYMSRFPVTQGQWY
ncbi:MAG: SUMF1/EgtB/PvdO family nonheme iron enzyme, partial [Treponema sp.]|nr:SUMF1/EgtB/PvdO family nonheme iron enzyme [Treponema sp.]